MNQPATLTQSNPPDAPAAAISLESLLAESLQEVSLRQQVKAGREALKDGRISKEDKEAISKTIQQWELTREWWVQADVVVFTRQKCQACGSFHVQFQGYYQRQRSRSSKIDRWVKVEKPDPSGNLPRESKYYDSLAELCENCAYHAGFEVED